MKVTLLKDKDIGLTRPRPAGSEIDVDPETGNAWIKAGDAMLSAQGILDQAPKRIIVSKPAEPKTAATADAEGKAKS